MNIKHHCITSHMFLITDAKNLQLKWNKLFNLILPLKPCIGEWENADLDHFNPKQFMCIITVLVNFHNIPYFHGIFTGKYIYVIMFAIQGERQGRKINLKVKFLKMFF